MTESSGWQFDVEIHPPDWVFPSGPSWVAGWVYAGENQHVTDLRAWVDGRPFLAIHGLPKPDRDARFLGRAGPPYAGFVVQVTPHRGAALLRLETRDPAGHWHEFFRQAISVAPDAPIPVPLPPLSDHLIEWQLRLLRLHAARPEAALGALADEVISTALVTPLNSLPNPPFHGALEEPRDIGWLRFGRMSVTGWLAHRTAKIRRISALVDAVQESTLRSGLPRPDIAAIFPDLPDIDRSQFVGHVDLPANQGVPALVKIFAELDNGEKHLVFAQRFIPRDVTGAETPLPPRSRRTFTAAWWALNASARSHGVPLGNLARLLAASRACWGTFQAEAPGRPRPYQAPASAVCPASDSTPCRLLVVTHNLNFEGAPWFIFELARYLAAQPGCTVQVVSPQEGPLRGVFAAAGIPVAVVDLAPAFAARTKDDFQRALSAAVALDWSAIDLVIANTMVSFWAISLATAARKPSLLYVHESAPIRRFFGPIMAPALFPLVEAAFHSATRVVFTADATRRVFPHLEKHDNFCLLPSWVDAARIDQFAAAHDRAALRAKHGLDPSAVLLVNIGSLCERKGQHIYLRAAELLRQELQFTYPGEKILWVMVGARPGPYLDSLTDEAKLLGLDNVVFLPETGEIFDFYRLADIFVCTSFEESFPRVLLESAAFQLPIVSTNVNGIAEMLAPDEAWLTPPGDRYRLAEAVKAALAAHFAGDQTRAERARASILRKYHEAHSLPQHLALIRTAARLQR